MTSTTATTSFPPGIYHIVVAGSGIVSQRLTRGHHEDGRGYVNILPPIEDDENVHQEVMHYFHEDPDCLSLTSPLTSGKSKVTKMAARRSSQARIAPMSFQLSF